MADAPVTTRSPAPWTVLASERVLDRRWLAIRQERVRTGRGKIIEEFHVVESPSWACVVCVTPQRELVLVEQYRHGIGELTWELPAGVVDPGEAPVDGARRELREETGYEAARWIAVQTLRPEPARHTHWAHIYAALDAEPSSAQELDDAEDARVFTVPLSDIDELIAGGRLAHAVHVAALLLCRARGLME